MLGIFSLPDGPERIAFARRLSLVIAGFGLVVAPLDFLSGNYAVAMLGLLAATFIPLALWAGRRLGLPTLPLYIVLAFLLMVALVGGSTQLHSMPNLVWLMLYPFVLMFLAGLHGGTLLTVAVFLFHVLAYWAYPQWHAEPRVPVAHFLQLLLAYSMASIVAFYYELLRVRHECQLRSLSEKDFLTGLANRRGFLAQAASVHTQAKRFRQPFCVVLVDIDDFKLINDTRGHDAGDLVLRNVAEILAANKRAYDLVGRWGGEEFILLIPQCAAEGAASLAEKIRRALAGHELPWGGRITASFGVAVHSGEEDIEAVIRRADEQLYRAKLGGKNCVFFDQGSAPLLAT